MERKRLNTRMKTLRIMIVEDESIIALDIRYIVQHLGYEVPAMAASGEESIDKAGSIHPDLILMDIQLKGRMDGISAAEKIQRSYDIPVIYLSAFGDDVTLERINRDRPFGFIQKPFSESELEETIERLLRPPNEIRPSR